MPPPNPASLSPFKAWILLLFHGKAQGPEHSPSQIADLLVRARCETSAAEVRQALHMWGELKESREEKILGLEEYSLLAPPPEQSSERPSVSHTPVDRPHGTSPFLHDGLEAYIELFGLPKGQPYPSHLPSAQRESPRSQMMERFIGSHDDPYMVMDTREQRRRAALEAPPREVDSIQCDINVLEVDDDMTAEPADTAVYATHSLPRPPSKPLLTSIPAIMTHETHLSSQVFAKAKDVGCFLYQDMKQHKSRVSTGQRKSKPSRRITTRTSKPSRSLETPPTEDLFGPDEFSQADDFEPPSEDAAFDTQFALSHWSNCSSSKRKRRSSAESDDEILDEREEEQNKRNRDELPLPAGNMPFWQIKLMRKQGRS